MVIIKQGAFIVLIISILFIVSCTVTDTDVINETLSVDIENQTDELNSGECSPEWICISTKIKAYQYSNCSIAGQKECPLGCQDGECKTAKTCDSGFTCINADMQAYRREDCTTTQKIWCDFGCSNNECNPQLENVTHVTETNETVAEEPDEAVPTIDINRLEIGDEVVVTVAELNYTLSIYNIDLDRVRIQVNSVRSDWLERTGNSTTVGGLEITIRDVLFQSYLGGLRAIEYTIP
ncbi:hypothetical protein COV17_01840 [Candidatus Woesearchaeota archaeon CG10_big_fil_rev_8_21_14_0_10_36_11]|nr:MAG: hypothetical protein COV17_01840 [Candidatus Woesearchaeota archaeon CG10_big_fil_rev_8_21_14_0_10_36_11]